MSKVKFGLFLPTGDFAKARAAAEWADTRGFYSVSINDHFFSPLGAPQTPQLECYATLSAIAAVTNNNDGVAGVAFGAGSNGDVVPLSGYAGQDDRNT